jgi:hypothetical protein
MDDAAPGPASLAALREAVRHGREPPPARIVAGHRVRRRLHGPGRFQTLAWGSSVMAPSISCWMTSVRLPEGSVVVFVGRHGAMNPAGRVRCNMRTK